MEAEYGGCRAKDVCIHSSAAHLHVGQAGTVTAENTAADLNPSAMQDVPGLAALLARERSSKSKLIQLRHRRTQAMNADENTAQDPPLEVEEGELEDTEERPRDDARSALAKSIEYLGPPPPRLEDAGQFHRTLTVLEDAHLTVGTLERIVATAQRADFRFFEFAKRGISVRSFIRRRIFRVHRGHPLRPCHKTPPTRMYCHCMST